MSISVACEFQTWIHSTEKDREEGRSKHYMSYFRSLCTDCVHFMQQNGDRSRYLWSSFHLYLLGNRINQFNWLTVRVPVPNVRCTISFCEEATVPSDHQRGHFQFQYILVRCIAAQRHGGGHLKPSVDPQRLVSELLDALTTTEIGKAVLASTWDSKAKKWIRCIRRVRKRSRTWRSTVFRWFRVQCHA